MKRLINVTLTFCAAMVCMAGSPQETRADFVYESLNDGEPNAPNFWLPSSIGWYWTPADSIELAEVQTQLTSGFSNINNNFTFTTELFTDRPAAGGTSLGSFTWNGVTFVDGPWLGGSFASPISLTGGVTYFLGMSGWQNAVGWNGGSSGAGVNWTIPNGSPGEDHVGLGKSYGDGGFGPFTFAVQFNPELGPNAPTEFPFLRFIAADPVDPPSDVPAPASLILWGMGGGLAFLGKKLRRRRTELAT